MTKLTEQAEKFRSDVFRGDNSIGVDEEAGRINGFVVCEEGRCKTPMRGEFDAEALNTIVQLGNENTAGVRMRFQHPSQSDDGLGSYVGRAFNFRMDEREGRQLVRADAVFNEVALTTSIKGGEPPAKYLLKLAKSDPGALQTSIVVTNDKLERQDDDGKRLPPLFRPKKLWASDFVDEGDAVHGDIFGTCDSFDDFMEGSGRRIPSKLAIAASEYLNQVFPHEDRTFIEQRFDGFAKRYLDGRFGPLETPDEKESVMDQETKDALAKQDAKIDTFGALVTEKFDALSAKLDAAEETRKAELSQQQRAAEISALCKQAGYPDPEQLISNDSLSVDGARKTVFDWKCSQTESLGSGTDNGAGTGKKETELDKLRAEATERADDLRKAGYKKTEDWVRFQCRDKGIEYKEPSAA
jgi:hypothetical protein